MTNVLVELEDQIILKVVFFFSFKKRSKVVKVSFKVVR